MASKTNSTSNSILLVTASVLIMFQNCSHSISTPGDHKASTQSSGLSDFNNGIFPGSDAGGSSTLPSSDPTAVASPSPETVNVINNNLPVVTSEPLAPSAQDEGTTLTLSFSVSGPAPISVQWYHNNVAINGATQTQFSKSNIGIDDAGSYYATIANSYGSGASTRSVTVSVNSVTPVGTVVATQTYSGLASIPNYSMSCAWAPPEKTFTAPSTGNYFVEAFGSFVTPISGSASASFVLRSSAGPAVFSASLANNATTSNGTTQSSSTSSAIYLVRGQQYTLSQAWSLPPGSNVTCTSVPINLGQMRVTFGQAPSQSSCQAQSVMYNGALVTVVPATGHNTTQTKSFYWNNATCTTQWVCSAGTYTQGYLGCPTSNNWPPDGNWGNN